MAYACPECMVDCSGGCDTTCMSACVNTCKGTCTVACGTGCGGACGANCIGTCLGCSGTCKGTCTGSCSGGCKGTCTGCKGTCKGTCTGSCGDSCSGGCKNGCAGCEGYCIGTCNSTCIAGEQSENIAKLSLSSNILASDINNIAKAIEFEVVNRRGLDLANAVTFYRADLLDSEKINKIIQNLEQTGQVAAYSATDGEKALKVLAQDLIDLIKAANEEMVPVL